MGNVLSAGKRQFCVGLLLILTVINAVFADTPTKRALLIGIDEYQTVTDLKGCANDIELMRSILISKFDVPAENIAMLSNEQATRANIISKMQSHLIEPTNPGDMVILHYSGHGSQMRDEAGGDEIDGYDETIVAHDSRSEGVFDISDDEINGLLKQVTERTKNVTFILDSCHSGAASRGGSQVRMVEPDNRMPPAATEFALSSRAGEGEAGIRLNGADYVLISGCLASELSNESSFDNRRHGAMTWFLAAALEAARPGATYRSVMDDVKLNVTTQFPSQHPQVEGPGIDLKVFGTEKINPQPYVLVSSSEGDTVKLDGGEMLGLRNDMELKVYPPGTADFEEVEPTTTIQIIQVGAFSSQAKVVEGSPVLVNAKALIEESAFGDTLIAVFVEEAESQTMASIKNQLSQSTAMRLVDSADEGTIIVRQQNNLISVQSGDLSSLAPAVGITEPGHVDRVSNQVKDIVHWRSLRDLKNPTSKLRVEVNLVVKDGNAELINPLKVAPGQIITYRVENLTGDKSLYIYLLDVSSDGSVAVLFPPPGEQQTLAPGAVLQRDLEMFLPDEFNVVHDVIKVIATVTPINTYIFPQGALRDAASAEGTRAGSDPLSRFLASASRGTRGAKIPNVDTWVTAEQTIAIGLPQARTTGFTLHFDEPKELQDLPAVLGNSRNTCLPEDNSAAESCAEVRAISQDNTAFSIESDPVSRSDQDSRSIGNVFEEAYEIQAQTGAIRVEPNLSVDAPGIVDQQGIDKREILGDSSHNEAASNDDQWSLKQIRVFDAWEKIRQRHGVAEGQEGSGIYVAHTDTGYVEHPENWTQVNGKRPIVPELGYDYFEGDDDPLDPLLSDNKLDNPGHGTASGSVIVSPSGCQLDSAAGCVTGVARGAQLIPLRVNRTVSQFNTSNLAQAIRDVAEGNIEGKPGLISTAMGGPPTFNLYRAVKAAEDNGVLMIAAAGNYVRTVVWPARFNSTIAAAAVNVRCRPWKHSSRGSKVDISAPGESVWRATINKQGKHINYMGKGTTFATGNTSAAAALWLAWHKDNPEFANLKQQGKVTEAFRNALRHSAWQPQSSGAPSQSHCDNYQWDSDNFGPGILDVSALLDAPLSVAATRSLETLPIEAIPLFASLYPEDTVPAKIAADYRSLLNQPADTPLDEISQFETEILYHYTMDADVQRTLDGMLQGQREIESINRVNETLLRQDLSGSLRKLLAKIPS